jgi:palmitoyl transferase
MDDATGRMSLRRRQTMVRMLRWITCTAMLASAAAFAQTAPAPAAGSELPKARRWADCTTMTPWLNSQCAGFRDAWYDGKPTVYLSGYTWHDRNTYTEEKIDSFNEQAWGGGYGWGQYEPTKGDHFGWYAMVFRDSHYDYTKMAGWGWVTYWPERSDFAVGLGYTVFLMSRPDIANNWPFPAALPLATVKLGRAEILGTFIPKLNAGINHGNVAYFFGRYQF